MSRKANFDVTGAWLEGDDPGDRKFIKIGDLLLENGETLPDITIAYQSWGTLNAQKSNAILVNHAMTGWSDVPGWWPQMVGPGLPFDTDKYFSDALGIDKYLLAVGPSLGGMRSLEWAVQLPERVSAICTIGSSAVATGDQIGTFSVQIQAIKSDPHFNGGDYYEQERGPVDGMGIARRIAHLTYRTESEMDVRFGRQLQGDETGRYAVQSYLDHQANKLAKRFDANTYIALTDAMNSHDIGRERGGVVKALASVKVPVVVVSIDTDRLFVPRLQVEISELVPTAEPPIVISSEFGHDGFLVESEAMGAAIRHALHVAGTI